MGPRITGRSIRIDGTTTRVATTRPPGFALLVADGDGESEGDALGGGDAHGDGEALGSSTVTGLSEGTGPAVAGSVYERRPPVSNITLNAVTSAGMTR